MAEYELKRLNGPLLQQRHDLIVKYYRDNRAFLQPALDARVAAGKRLALWTSGTDRADNMGLAFAEVYDPDKRLFECLTYRGRWNVEEPQHVYPTMPLRKAVVKFDALFLFRPSLYPQVLARHDALLPTAELVSVEDLIWEGIAKRNARARSGAAPGRADGATSAGGAISTASSPRVCSLTILYNPGQDTFDAVKSYSHLVDKAYLYDNSPQPNEALCAQLAVLPNVEYVSGEGVNAGMGAPINRIAARAKAEGFDWLITFDQDSVAGEGMIQKMREFAASPRCTPSIAFIGPMVHKGGLGLLGRLECPEVTYRNRIIQSGMMHRLSAMDEIGPYDERLFIDEVENEYCARARELGFDAVMLNNAPLLHQINDEIDEREINKYAPLRFYYRARNMLHMIDRFSETNPKYAYATVGGLLALNQYIESDDEGVGEKALAMMLGFQHYAENRWPTYDEACKELDELRAL